MVCQIIRFVHCYAPEYGVWGCWVIPERCEEYCIKNMHVKISVLFVCLFMTFCNFGIFYNLSSNYIFQVG